MNGAISTQDRGARQLELQIMNPLAGHDLVGVEFETATLLLSATREHPLTNGALRELLSYRFVNPLSEREVKDVIRSLRREHQFPILSSRVPPFGYWWCASATEMREFIERFKQQPLDELTTCYRMLRRHYPELLGQLDFDFSREEHQ